MGAANRWLHSRDGDLRSIDTTTKTILHRITTPGSLKPGVPFQLLSRLNLTVGGNGIIGRRVSLLAGQTVLGQGIVGWN